MLFRSAESQIALAESSQSLTEKDREIEELKSLLNFSGKLKRVKNAYFEVNESGELFGDPYCQSCWETKKTAVHLTSVNALYNKCSSCGTQFNARLTRL